MRFITNIPIYASMSRSRLGFLSCDNLRLYFRWSCFTRKLFPIFLHYWRGKSNCCQNLCTGLEVLRIYLDFAVLNLGTSRSCILLGSWRSLRGTLCLTNSRRLNQFFHLGLLSYLSKCTQYDFMLYIMSRDFLSSHRLLYNSFFCFFFSTHYTILC